jgi:hypothetical protein
MPKIGNCLIVSYFYLETKCIMARQQLPNNKLFQCYSFHKVLATISVLWFDKESSHIMRRISISISGQSKMDKIFYFISVCCEHAARFTWALRPFSFKINTALKRKSLITRFFYNVHTSDSSFYLRKVWFVKFSVKKWRNTEQFPLWVFADLASFIVVCCRNCNSRLLQINGPERKWIVCRRWWWRNTAEKKFTHSCTFQRGNELL